MISSILAFFASAPFVRIPPSPLAESGPTVAPEPEIEPEDLAKALIDAKTEISSLREEVAELRSQRGNLSEQIRRILERERLSHDRHTIEIAALAARSAPPSPPIAIVSTEWSGAPPIDRLEEMRRLEAELRSNEMRALLGGSEPQAVQWPYCNCVPARADVFRNSQAQAVATQHYA